MSYPPRKNQTYMLNDLLFPAYQNALEQYEIKTNHYELVVKKTYVVARLKVYGTIIDSKSFSGGGDAYELAKLWLKKTRTKLWLEVMEVTNYEL